ncbi:MAG: hypothetical protein HKM89_03235 [Gemmatimonadales bacterium]|nr:hypothetical protein [Gemmatimonadales bacterium]
MTCSESRDRLLEAEVHELRGEGDSALAGHILTCTRCRALADRILEEQDHILAALTALTPPGSADQAARVAARHSRWRQFRTRALIPAAAAAAALALLLFRGADQQFSTTPNALAPTPLVEASQDQDVIVYHTANPDIVVVWLY